MHGKSASIGWLSFNTGAARYGRGLEWPVSKDSWYFTAVVALTRVLPYITDYSLTMFVSPGENVTEPLAGWKSAAAGALEPGRETLQDTRTEPVKPSVRTTTTDVLLPSLRVRVLDDDESANNPLALSLL